jgi:ABC-type nitrate/sulfonate/bicarbonate transport system substrate-binding protein
MILRKNLGVLALAASTLLAGSASVQAADTVRIGLPTKAYWPTILVTAGIQKGIFAKEGLKAEMTIYRGGAETFESIAAGSSDVGVVAASLVAIARMRGVKTKIVGNGADEWSGWILGVTAKSPIKNVKELNGKKVGITSAGSGTDALALWAQTKSKVTFKRVAVGGAGLVPNLLSKNLDAAVIYSPLSYQEVAKGTVRPLIQFATAMPRNLTGGWAVTDKLLKERPKYVQRVMNAIYGSLHYMLANRDYSIKLIASNNELPIPVATMEFDKTFGRLSKDGKVTLDSVKVALTMAKASGAKKLAPAKDIFQNIDIKPTKM